MQGDLILCYQTADVDKRIAHTAKRGIDADARELSNFFECEVHIVAQHNDLALLGRERVDKAANFGVRLVADDIILFVAFGIFDEGEYIKIISNSSYGRAAFVFAEIIDAKVVSNAQSPLQKLAFFVVFAAAEGVYNFYECILEDIVGEVVVAHEHKNRRVDF